MSKLDWIKCTEYLPEHGQRVFYKVISKHVLVQNDIMIGNFKKENPFFKAHFCSQANGSYIVKDVSHWAELDFPPEEEEKENEQT